MAAVVKWVARCTAGGSFQLVLEPVTQYVGLRFRIPSQSRLIKMTLIKYLIHH